MEAWIASLAAVLSALLAISSRNVAKTEEKKARLAKDLINVVEAMADITARGYEIIAVIQALLDTRNPEDFEQRKAELLKQIDDQIHDLWSLNMHIQDSILDRALITNEIEQILDVYLPGWYKMFRVSINGKGGLLVRAGRTLRDDFINLEQDNLVLWEYRPLNPSRAMIAPSAMEHISNLRFLYGATQDVSQADIAIEGFETVRYDLSEKRQRERYLRGARKRLKGLESLSQQLATFVRQNFEPHHLI